MLEPVTLTAPSAWASFLINTELSNLTPLEQYKAWAWVEAKGLGWPVSCEDAGFCKKHDAWDFWPFEADCQTYTFLVSRP